jgi:hypothetical protein
MGQRVPIGHCQLCFAIHVFTRPQDSLFIRQPIKRAIANTICKLHDRPWIKTVATGFLLLAQSYSSLCLSKSA